MEKGNALYQPQLDSLPLIQSGKVRDLFAINDQHILIVTSDRLSAFDVVLPDPIPGKGRILNEISNFWFGKFERLIPNHLSEIGIRDIIEDPDELEALAGRTVIAKKLKPLPVEAVVRGYLIGSGWKDYQAGYSICGLSLPHNLQQAEKLPEPLFTPATKAMPGEHDENIDFERVADLIGRELAVRVRDISIRIYSQAAEYALERDIIIADTKFEFGLDDNNELVLIDELLTPDSSRFWPAASYRTGTSPPSFDKQYIRDYLETLNWDKRPPAPHLPQQVIENTAAKYAAARDKLIAK